MAGEMSMLRETELGRLICNNDMENFQRLLPLSDPFLIDAKGNTYLHLLATMNRPYIFHSLAATGIEINHQNKDGNTALHVSALTGDPCHIQDIIAYGCDPYIPNKEGKIACDLQMKNQTWLEVYRRFEPGLWRAVENNDAKTVQRLLSFWCKPDVAVREILTVHKKRQVKVIKTLRQVAHERRYSDILKLIDESQFTLMVIYGVLETNLKKIRYALERSPCDVNFLNKASPISHILQHTIQRQNIDMVRLLCRETLSDFGETHSVANVNVPVLVDACLQAPLFFEVLKARCLAETPIFNEVMSLRPNLELKDERGRAVLTFALDQTKGEISADVAETLIANGLDLASRDMTGATARDVARFARRHDIVELIDKQMVKFIRDSDVTALNRLAMAGYGQNLFITYKYKDAMVLASGNDTDDAQRFYEWLPNFQDASKKIHSICTHGDLDKLKQLLRSFDKHRLLVRVKDKGGRTPIMLAILHEQLDIASYLEATYGEHVLLDTDNLVRTVSDYFESLEKFRAAREQQCPDGGSATSSSSTGSETCSTATIDVEQEKKAVYGLDRELECLDKYEELVDIIESEKKGTEDFVKVFLGSALPFSTLISALCPRGSILVSGYRDLALLARDRGKEEIAKFLINAMSGGKPGLKSLAVMCSK